MYFWMFYPLGLDLPRERVPWLSGALIGLMALIFLWSRYLPDALTVLPWDLIYYVGASPPWTILSAVFLHADWMHLIGNLVYLVVFLPPLEQRLGPGVLLMLMLATGVAGNLAHGLVAWQNWLGQGGLGILGASGLVSGLLGYALIRVPHAQILVAYWVFAPLQGQNRAGRARMPLPAAVLAWLLLQVAQALVAGETGSTVSYGAHLGGFAMGTFLALVLGGVREARGEAALLRARRHLSRAEGWPAVGAYTEYLETSPDDLSARLEQARAVAMTGPRSRPADQYRDTYRRAVAARRWDIALIALQEGRRLESGLGLRVEELAAAAQQADRTGDRSLAIMIYQDLVLGGRRHPAVDRAWVRLVLLLRSQPDGESDAELWCERALAVLPPGAWRDYLRAEFTTRTAPGAGTVRSTAPEDPESGA